MNTLQSTLPLKKPSEALFSMQYFQEAVKRIRIQREMKPGEKTALPQYG